MANMFLPEYFSKKEKFEGEQPATKEDIKKIKEDIQEIKNIYINSYDIGKAEKEFYDENGIE